MIQVNNVSLKYYLGIEKVNSLKEFIIKKLKGRLKYDEFWALNDMSFTINSGEVFGVVGANGAGKSSLLKVIAGVLKPTKGSVAYQGRLSPLIELGAGFDPELSARENIYLNAAVLGYSKKFIAERFDGIVAYAELENFIDVPVKNFSSGMVSRLAFAVGTSVEPEILIVDEILSVGDMRFAEKSGATMRKLMEGGATVLFVSHNIQTVIDICDRVLWIDHGRMKMIGEAKEVCAAFADSMGA